MRVEADHSYGCVMAPLPLELAQQVMDFAAEIPDDEVYTDPEDDSFGREDKPHITLKYGLHTSNPDDVASLLAEAKPLKAKLKGISIFDGDDYIVLKIDVTGQSLHAMNKLICDNLKVTDTHPTYHPHATIAYLRKNGDDPEYYRKYMKDERFDGVEVELSEVVFSGTDDGRTRIPLTGATTARRGMRAASVPLGMVSRLVLAAEFGCKSRRERGR